MVQPSTCYWYPLVGLMHVVASCCIILHLFLLKETKKTSNHRCQLNRRIQGPSINRTYICSYFFRLCNCFGIVIHAHTRTIIHQYEHVLLVVFANRAIFSNSYYHHTSSSSFSRFTNICIIMCVLCLFIVFNIHISYILYIRIYICNYLPGGYFILSGILWFRPSNL